MQPESVSSSEVQSPIVCPGLFYAVPAQDGVLFRIRTPGGLLSSYQAKLLADFTQQVGNGFLQITNRANFQFRTPQAEIPIIWLEHLQQSGLAAANPNLDHLRNVMASPTAGLDPIAQLNPLPWVQALDAYITDQPALAALSPKFSIGLDGSESVSVRDRPNDIWLVAATNPLDQMGFQVYLSLGEGQELDTGLWVPVEHCVSIVAAIAQTYREYLPRIQGSRKKPRLRQILHEFRDEFLQQVIREAAIEPSRPAAVRSIIPQSATYQHLGIHPQQQPGLSYLGLVIPLGFLSADQLRALGKLAADYGDGSLRLTPWQNLLIPNVSDDQIVLLQQEVEAIGLSSNPTHPGSALVACAGKPGCAASATQTQTHALQLLKTLETAQLQHPVNIYLSGCPKSCAQHHQSDIALLGTVIPPSQLSSDQPTEAYHLYVGAGDSPFGRQLFSDIPADQVPDLIQSILKIYQDRSQDSFQAFVGQFDSADLKQLFQDAVAL